jgi:hypothetical protein|tara:strand:+ start:75 stop:314 length:240 start_codon:yes stop_codon:yes gene_type:complete
MKNKYWFKRKAYGYGATPTTWEGWLVTLGFVAIIIWRSFGAEKNPLQFTLELIVSIFILIKITSRKTEGGFGWQWGQRV